MKLNLNAILIFVWTLLLLNLRPSLIGQSYNAIVFVLFVVVSVYTLQRKAENGRFSFNNKEITMIGALFVLFSYLLVQGFILNPEIKTVLNSVVVMTGSAICIFFIVRSPENRSLIVKYLIYIHFYLSLSQIVTFCLFLLADCEFEQLPIIANLQHIAKYYYGIDNGLIHNLVFPFTITWSSFDFFGVFFYRTCGIYREPGMAQLFYLTSFFFTFFYAEKGIFFKRVIILIGSVLVLSASGFLNLVIGLIFYFVFNKFEIKKVSKSTIVKALIGFVLFTGFVTYTYISVQDKLSIVSGTERLDNMIQSYNRFKENPVFGQGYYNGFKTDSAGIVTSSKFFSFIGVFNQIGIVGILLYSLSWFLGIRNFASRRTWCIYIPCLVTLLSSQPSYNDVFTIFLLLFDTSRLHSDNS